MGTIHRLADPAPQRQPTLPSHYRMLQRLGEGGFGEVYEAWDEHLRRPVAIKRLKPVSDSQQASRLLHEARLAASLQHAAFVKIHALEEDGADHSIIMELVRGQTLKQLLSSAPPSTAEALAMVRQIAEAMCEAHDSGLVHGDLKPSNLMLEPAGAVRVLDFGLAVHADTQETVSLVLDQPQGTIAYMAPERLLGQPLRPQGDIYALGVLLYELTTGAPPFASLQGLALAAAQVQTSADRWAYPPSMPPALVKLICDMAAHAPEQRLATMQQVCARIAAIESGGAAAAELVHPAVAPAPWWRERRWQRPVVGALLATLLAAGGAWLAWTHAPSPSAFTRAFQPYSEASAMQGGLQALSMWDRRGALAEAEQRFDEALKHNPDNAAAVAGLSLTYSLYFVTEHYDAVWLRKARAAAQRALSLNGQLALSHAAMATVLLHEEKNAQALDGFEQALRLDPDNIAALDGKIHALNRLRREDEALRTAQAALLRHPTARVFADHIGAIHYAAARYAEAEKAFRHSIQLQPDVVAAYASLSAVLASQDKPDEALSVLQQGLQIQPSAWLYGNLGNTLFLRGDYAGAAAAFEAAVAPDRGNPNDYLGWANLADTLLWIPGREPEAKQAYARASELLAPILKASPDDVTLVSRMSLYFARSGERARCLELVSHALALAPSRPEVQFRAGLAYELIGERSLALAALQRARQAGFPINFIEAAPELVALRRDRGYAQLR